MPASSFVPIPICSTENYRKRNMALMGLPTTAILTKRLEARSKSYHRLSPVTGNKSRVIKKTSKIWYAMKIIKNVGSSGLGAAAER
jgi:hypothetical protein